MAYDSDKTHSELIEERDYWKRESERVAIIAKDHAMILHSVQDLISDSLGS